MSRTRVTRAPDRRTNDDRERFICEVVDDLKCAEPSARAKGIVYEVERPSLLHGRDRRRGITVTERHAATNTLTNWKIRLAIDAADSVQIHDGALAAQQDGETPVTEAEPLCGDIFEPLAQRSIVAHATTVVPQHSSIALRDCACNDAR